MVSNPLVPKLYGLPKIHKIGPLKMRPVVSNINSPNYRIAKWLLKDIKYLPLQEGCSIKNSFEFVNKIKDVILEDDEFINVVFTSKI